MLADENDNEEKILASLDQNIRKQQILRQVKNLIIPAQLKLF